MPMTRMPLEVLHVRILRAWAECLRGSPVKAGELYDLPVRSAVIAARSGIFEGSHAGDTDKKIRELFGWFYREMFAAEKRGVIFVGTVEPRVVRDRNGDWQRAPVSAQLLNHSDGFKIDLGKGTLWDWHDDGWRLLFSKIEIWPHTEWEEYQVGQSQPADRETAETRKKRGPKRTYDMDKAIALTFCDLYKGKLDPDRAAIAKRVREHQGKHHPEKSQFDAIITKFFGPLIDSQNR